MSNIEDKPINGQMDFVSFKELVEELCGAPFEEVYKEYLIHGEDNAEAKSNLG